MNILYALRNNFLIIFCVLAAGCANGQGNRALEVRAFSDSLKALPGAVLVDVRTPEEYTESHLLNAQNICWTCPDFEQEIVSIDKNNPVFVYCAVGGRSAQAASKLRSMGYKKVYDLKGGIRAWHSQGMPETR